MSRNYIRNITIDEHQQKIVREHFGSVKYGQIAKMIGEKYGKTVNNIRAMGLIRYKCDTIEVKREGYFNVDEFFKQYSY